MNAGAQPHDGVTNPVALFVMGMGRSGTSALTRVLSLCGGTLPAALVGADSANPLGYWEPRAATYLNEKIFYRHRSSWFDPTLRLQEEGAFGAAEAAAYTAEIGAFLNRLPTAPLLLIKEPRITALSHLWFEAARQAGFDIATVVAVRHPLEVMASLAAHRPVSPELSSALWLKYSLLAENHTRALPRVFVEYGNLLDNWRHEMKRITVALGVDLDGQDEDAIESFLKQELRHQHQSGPVTEAFGTDWMSTTYEALRAAARDEPWDASELDRVFEAYRAGEHRFRTAIEDFRTRFNGVPFRPQLMKLALEMFAVAHRRRGTWA